MLAPEGKCRAEDDGGEGSIAFLERDGREKLISGRCWESPLEVGGPLILIKS